MESIEGQALVASPYLMDPNFLRSVVYILRHDDEGAVGLILNRPTDSTVSAAFAKLDEEVDVDHCVYYGGPVPGPLMMIRSVVSDKGNYLGLGFEAEPEGILRYCQHVSAEPREEEFRVFSGYSGWGAGQLDSELKAGGWLVWDVAPHQVFSDPEQIWKTAIKEIGRDILAEGIDPDLIPEDPAFN